MGKFADYKNLSIEKVQPNPVSEEEVNSTLQAIVTKSVTQKTKEGKSSLGDIVNIDFEGFIDGVAFEGGKGEKFDLELGSNSFIPGFEEQLVGYEKGDEVDVNVSFPEDYHAEQLKGKPAVFKCKIHEVKEKVIPALDDNFAKAQGFENVEDLRSALKEQMEQKNIAASYNKYFEAVCSYLVENSELEVSEEQMNKSMDNVLAYYEQSVSRYGISLPQYLEMTGKTLDEFKESLKPEAIRGAKINMILDHIAQEEAIKVSEEEVEIELNKLAQYYHLNEEQIKEFRNKNLGEFEDELLKQKVFRFVVENL